VLDFVLDHVGSDPATYAVLALIIFVDDFVPFAPGDTAMITAGIIAANEGLSLPLVIAVGALGGIAGDNAFYLLGRRVGPPLARRFLRGPRASRLYGWAKHQLAVRGATVIIVGRFIPAGRTATTFACGTIGYRYRRFLVADTVAATAWATYTALLGYLGGNAFRERFWLPLLLGLALALLLGAATEAVREARGRREAPHP
jgi:membrane protein DedA with SNARE-associated domain